MKDTEIVKIAVKALDSKKAEDIRILKVEDLTIIANYFIIVGGTSTTQVKSLADEVEFQLDEAGVKPARTEGYQGSTWIILDYTDVIVHVFHRETREFYDLERLWQDGEQISPEDFLK